MLSKPHVRSRGFSMVEPMTVIGVAVILLTIGAPSFSSLVHREKITVAVNDFLSAMNLARSEAIHRGVRVDLVPDRHDWNQGWTVFIDNNNNQQPDAGEHIILTHGPVPRGVSIKASLTDSAVQYLAYTGTGRTRTNASSQSPQLGSISFYAEDQVRKIKINFLGRHRVCNPSTEERNC